MNFRHPWYPVIVSLEQRFGRLAFPGLIRAIAIFQFIVVLISAMQPDYKLLLLFDWQEIKSGQIWRLFTFVFIPRTSSILWGVVAMLFLWFINDILEEAWGAYRVTMYVFGSILLYLVCIILMPPVVQGFISYYGSNFIYTAIFLAAAALVPDHEIRLMFVIPIKMKWIGWVVLAFALYSIFSLAGANLEGFAMIAFVAAMLPYMLVFLPKFAFEFKHRQKAKLRKARFESAHLGDDEAFHRCEKCGKTELQDPDAEFRIENDDKEYCLDCLKDGVQNSA
tara:strand:+ start:20997 stop:21836 length:840 start_codon:yes stop_codon:yes gene_type:complete